MKTAPRGFPWGAAGTFLFTLTRQPLCRLGQPETAAPDSYAQVASAPGEWSCIQGKQMAKTEQLCFPAHFVARGRWRCPGDGAGCRRAPGAIGGVRIAVGAGYRVERVGPGALGRARWDGAG